MPPIPISLGVEDPLSEAVVRKLLVFVGREYAPATIYNQGGFGYLKTRIAGFNNAAKRIPYLIVTDLDKYECPMALIEDWLDVELRPNMMLRVAVREIESWVLAHREAFAQLLGIRLELVPEASDELIDPKRELINLARRSSRAEVRRDLCPPANSTRQVGPNYNGRLSAFIASDWQPQVARLNSPSLERTIVKLTNFVPTW